MDDTIRRQEAIDAICEHYTDLERRGITVLSVANHKQVTADLLECIPSAQRTGRWVIEIEAPHFGTQCSECGWAWSDNIDAIKLTPVLSLIKTNYCPNCGARMEVEE